MRVSNLIGKAFKMLMISRYYCFSCGKNKKREGQSNCRICHATYMRGWRKINPLTESQRKKDNCRSYSGVYLSRGKLARQTCEICGSRKSQMHHEDYSKPLKVNWLCRPCHLWYHKNQGKPKTFHVPNRQILIRKSNG